MTAGCAFEEQVAFASVAGEGCCAGELDAGFLDAAEFVEEFAADAGEEVVVLEGGFGYESVYDIEAGCGAECHGDRYGAIELHDGRRCELGERIVKGCDASPVGFVRGAGAGVAGGDGGLKGVGTVSAAQLFGMIERGEAATDEDVVPAGAILIEQEDGLSGGGGSRA
jgi:hypothetical protein